MVLHFTFLAFYSWKEHLRPFTESHQKNGTLNTFLSKQTIISLIYSTKKYGKHNENNSKKMYVSILLKNKNKNVIRENVSAHTHKITKLLQGKYAPLSLLRCNISFFFFCASSSSVLFSVIKTNRLFPFSSLFPLSAIYLPCKINEIYAKLYTKSHIIVWENCE